MNIKKVVIYIRVSTLEQKTDNQLKVLREYCKHQNWFINEIYIDRGQSGLSDKRPNFNRMLKDMRSRKFNTLIIWKLDRVGRSLQHLLLLLQEMQNKKIDLIVTSQNIDTTTAAGKLMFSVIGAFAEFESSLISERTKLGMERAKLKGKHIGRPKKDIKKYPEYCIVSQCRVRVFYSKKLCERHEKEYGKILSKKGVPIKSPFVYK